MQKLTVLHGYFDMQSMVVRKYDTYSFTLEMKTHIYLFTRFTYQWNRLVCNQLYNFWQAVTEAIQYSHLQRGEHQDPIERSFHPLCAILLIKLFDFSVKYSVAFKYIISVTHLVMFIHTLYPFKKCQIFYI